MGLTHELENAALEPSKRLLRDYLLVLLRLEVATGEQRHQITELASAKLRSERNAQHVCVGRVVDVVVDAV